MNYVIWSEEHGAWWGTDDHSLNYTRSHAKARRYSNDEGEKIVFDANCFLEVGQINEVAIPDPWPRPAAGSEQGESP